MNLYCPAVNVSVLGVNVQGPHSFDFAIELGSNRILIYCSQCGEARDVGAGTGAPNAPSGATQPAATATSGTGQAPPSLAKALGLPGSTP